MLQLCPCRGARGPLEAGRPQRGRTAARRTGRPGIEVLALDAALPFDYEGKMQKQLSRERQLKIGIVGFGKFGQFLAKRLVEHGHQVLATSRTPYVDEATELGVEFFTDAHDFCESHPDVVILATSIISLESVLFSLPFQRLKRSTLIVDVLSVKVFPKQLFMRTLPPELDLLCTHPMFGPDSGQGSWKGLNFMYECVRVGDSPERQHRVQRFLQFFKLEGCNMIEMTCEEHDKKAASTQFITHTVGRVLGAMDLESTNLDTKGYQSLVNLVSNTTHDSFDLYYGLFMYNQNATEELDRLERAFQDVKSQLFDQLHGVLREQLFHMKKDAAQGAVESGPDALPTDRESEVPMQQSENGHRPFNSEGTNSDASLEGTSA
ncbi:unnamed protein product [Ostreobium quekettii]|uniref:Prephenate/arogenate dehydrogenase domain-containing protein n=1 Tax=Ostreobium quekettii TaxID=121088 RepID=A0A8S1ITN4_9CHLO|nr:unnamed protein product [Ostreobium quekettii]